MKQRDDSSLSPDQYRNVRREAEQILHKASAIGRFPTPLGDIMDAAKVIVAPEDIFDENFLQKMRRKAGDTLKRALSKVIGLFDSKSRVIFIDGSVHKNKLPFLKIHETGHGVLPWQQSIYTIIEDCKKSLSPEISDLFDREANVFASEVL